MNRGRGAAAAVCALAALLAGGALAGGFGRLVHRKDSLYHRIFVYRQGSVVTLQFARSSPWIVQSQVDVSDLRRHVLEYTTLAFGGLLYVPEPSRALVVGLGGGVIPRELRHHFPELRIDVAEIDPAIPPIAEEFFGFRTDERLQVHVMDGRVFVKRQLRREPRLRYDLIILDAFTAEYIPFHLMTREFFEELEGLLADDGVIVANVLSTNRLADAELKTLMEVFGRCQAFVARTATNALLVVPGPALQGLTADEALGRAEELQRRHGFSFRMRTVARKLQPYPRPDPRARVLTDDQAPVNWLRTREAERPAEWARPQEAESEPEAAAEAPAAGEAEGGD
jgi:spermidine synthase